MEDARILAAYAEHQRNRGLSENTVRCYQVQYRAFIRDLETCGLTLLTVERATISQWIQSHGNLNRTRHHYTARFSLLFNWMADVELRDDVPTKGLPRVKVPRSIPRPIAAADLYRALECADPRVGLMLTLTAYAGLRRAEVAGLTRANVLDDRDPPLLLIFGKGSKERLVPIGPVVAAALERYGLPESGPLFPGQHGPLKPHTVGLLIAEHYRACGIGASAHNGRHTFASQLYQTSGADLLVVQQMLGHSSPATTAIYAAWSPERAVAAIAALPSRP